MKTVRWWRPNHKLTEADVIAIRLAAESRTDRQLMLALASVRKLTRHREVMRERSKHGRGPAPDPRGHITLAMTFGVSHRTIGLVLRRERWKGVE